MDRQPLAALPANLSDYFSNPSHVIAHILHTYLSSERAMLYLIGLGLADHRDISVKGLEIVKKAERVYLEAYTAVLLVDKEQLVSRQHNTSLGR